MIYLNLLLIALVSVLIIDISGFIESLKLLISKLLTKSQLQSTQYRIKPFDCSFCMTFWVGLIYTIVTGEFNLVTLAAILLIAFMTEPIKQLLILVKDLLIKIIDVIYGKVID